MCHGVHTADARRQIVPAGSQQVVEGDNERGGLHVASAVASQIAGEIILDIVQVHTQKVKIVLADFPHQLIDFPGTEHGIVGLPVPDGDTARVGEELGQFVELLFRQTVKQIFHLVDITADTRFGVLMHIPINEINILFRIGHVVILLILA